LASACNNKSGGYYYVLHQSSDDSNSDSIVREIEEKNAPFFFQSTQSELIAFPHNFLSIYDG